MKILRETTAAGRGVVVRDTDRQGRVSAHGTPYVSSPSMDDTRIEKNTALVGRAEVLTLHARTHPNSDGVAAPMDSHYRRVLSATAR